MKRHSLLVLGAKSDIGIAVAYRFAKEGFDVQLAARNSNSLKDYCSDLKIRYGVDATFHELDALNLSSHENFLSSLPKIPEVALFSIGTLGNQKEDEKNISQSIESIRINFEGLVSIFGLLANRFQERGSGSLIGISSVAGDRGRASNYIYGSAKAGLSAFLSGLRNRMHPYGVDVITVKPGFVKTKMTSQMNLPRRLTTNSKNVANAIYSAYKYRKTVIYVKPIWKYIMQIIKLIPETLFKRMKL